MNDLQMRCWGVEPPDSPFGGVPPGSIAPEIGLPTTFAAARASPGSQESEWTVALLPAALERRGGPDRGLGDKRVSDIQ